MKIEKRWLVHYSDVMPGQVFEFNGRICLRTEWKANAINLENGKFITMEDDKAVTVYENAKVVLI